eukprot:4050093-Pyramimonas_sp.AAC.1
MAYSGSDLERMDPEYGKHRIHTHTSTPLDVYIPSALGFGSPEPTPGVWQDTLVGAVLPGGGEGAWQQAEQAHAHMPGVHELPPVALQGACANGFLPVYRDMGY